MVTTNKLPLSVIIDWDVKNWSLVLNFWNRYSELTLPGCRALEIGSHKGGLSVYLANLGLRVVCSDIIPPSNHYRSIHQQMKPENYIKYAAVDACAIPFHDSCFDIVIFKSVLGGLKTYVKQTTMMGEIYRVLKMGGELWFAENLISSRLHQSIRRVFVPWGNTWRYLSMHEVEELCRPFRSTYLKQYGFFGALGRLEWQRSILGSFDSIADVLIPNKWKYIVFGLARK
jgi:ubiquinone/menaquinone biosynthesis C-methylase UbiE